MQCVFLEIEGILRSTTATLTKTSPQNVTRAALSYVFRDCSISFPSHIVGKVS